MKPTRRLYWDDARLFEFDAEVVAVGEHGVVLDRSAFYPEAGGQMADAGTLDGRRVIDVQIDEVGRIHHVLEGEPPEVGVNLEGRVDAARRIEHMSLHTGQHALSAALHALGAPTISSRLGSAATLDVGLVSDDAIDEAEGRVNALIDDARPVTTSFPSEAELAMLALRRTPKVDEGIRVIAIAGFDATPCGGTHCANTSEIGLLRITDRQSHRGGIRLTFATGSRARRDLVAEAKALRRLSEKFTCGPMDVDAAVAKLERDLGEARTALGAARSGWADAIADGLAEGLDGSEWCVRVFDGLDRGALAKVADRVATGSRVAVFGAPSENGMHVLVASGEDSDVDCRALFARLSERGGGRGGGRAHRAEGRFPPDVDLASLVASLEG